MAELKKKIAERESLKISSSACSREHSPALSHGHEEPTQLPPPPPRNPPPPENEHASFKPAAPAAGAANQPPPPQQQQQGIVGDNNNCQQIENNPGNPPTYQPNTGYTFVRGGVGEEDFIRPRLNSDNTHVPGFRVNDGSGPPWPVVTTTTTTTTPAPVVSGQQLIQSPNSIDFHKRVVLTQSQFEAALLDIRRKKQQALDCRDGIAHLLQEAERAYETLCTEEYTLVVQNNGLEGLLQHQQWQPPPTLPLPLPLPVAGGAPLAATAAAAGNISTKIDDSNTTNTNTTIINNNQPPPPPPVPGSLSLPSPAQLPLSRVEMVDLLHKEDTMHEIPPPPPPPLPPSPPPPPSTVGGGVQQQEAPPPPPPLEASPLPRLPEKEGNFIPEYHAVSQSLVTMHDNDSFIKRVNLTRSTRPFTTLLLSPATLTLDPGAPTLDAIARSLLGYSFDFGGYYLRLQGRWTNLVKKGERELVLLPPFSESTIDALTTAEKENDLLAVNLALASAQHTYNTILVENSSNTNRNSEGIVHVSKSNSDSATEQSKARTAAAEQFLKVLKTGLGKKPASQLLWPYFLQAYLSQPSITASEARATIDAAAKLAPGYATWLAAAAKAPTAISAAVILHRGAVTLVQSDKKYARKAKLTGTVLDLILRAVRAVCCTSAPAAASMSAGGGSDLATGLTAPVVSTLCQWHAAWCSAPWYPLPLPVSTETVGPLVLHPEQRELILSSLQPHPTMLCILWSSLAFAAAYDRLPTAVEHRLGEQQQALRLEWPLPIPNQRLHFVASALEQGLQALRITPAVYYKYIELLEDSSYDVQYTDTINMARSCFVDTIRRFGHRTKNRRPLYFQGDAKSPDNVWYTARVRTRSADGKPDANGGGGNGQQSPPPPSSSPSSFPSPGVIPKSVDRILVASSHPQAAEVLAREDHGWPRGGDVGLALFQAYTIAKYYRGSDDGEEKKKNGDDDEPRDRGGGSGGSGFPHSLINTSINKNKPKDTTGSDMDISSDGEEEEDEKEKKKKRITVSGGWQSTTMLRRSFWENHAKVLVNLAATTPAFPKSPSQLQWPPVEPKWLRGRAGGHFPLALEARQSNIPDYVQVGALVFRIKDLPAEALLPVYEEVQCRRIFNGAPAAAEICVALLRRAIELAAAIDELKGDEDGDDDTDVFLPLPGEDYNNNNSTHTFKPQQEGNKKKRKKTRREGGGGKRGKGKVDKYAHARASGSSLLMSAPPAASIPTVLGSTKDISSASHSSVFKEASQKTLNPNGLLSNSPLVSWALPAAAGALVSSTPPAAACVWLEAIHLTALLSTAPAWELLEAALEVHPLNPTLREAEERLR